MLTINVKSIKTIKRANPYFFLIVLLICLSSCAENQGETKNEKNELCCEIASDSIIKMKGTLTINSKGEYIFKGINHAAEGRGSGTYLIPCDERLREYIASAYDSYTHLRNMEESFYVMTEGKYLSDNLINERDSTSFLFNYVYLIDPLPVQNHSKLVNTNWTSRFFHYCNYYHFNTDSTGFSEDGQVAWSYPIDTLGAGISGNKILYEDSKKFKYIITDTILTIEYLTWKPHDTVYKRVFYFNSQYNNWVSEYEYAYGEEHLRKGERIEKIEY